MPGKLLGLTILIVASALTFLVVTCGDTIPIKHESLKGKGEVIRIGAIFSETGSMAITEISQKDALQMAIDEINDNGGLLGKKVELTILDSESDASNYIDLSNRLINDINPTAIFTAWPVGTQDAAEKVFDRDKGLLFDLSPYFKKRDKNVVHVGSSPNQSIIPAVEYLLHEKNTSYNTFVLLGSDEYSSHATNRLIKSFLLKSGLSKEKIVERYTADGDDFEQTILEIKKYVGFRKPCIINTIKGDLNIAFYKAFANAGLSAEACPIMALTIAEDEIRQMDPEFISGHLFTSNYFQSAETDKNIRFVSDFKLYCAIKELPVGIDRVTSNGICWAYTAAQLWGKAVKRANSLDPEKVQKALYQLEYNSPAGKVQVQEKELTLAKPVFIGESTADGQINVLWKSDSCITPITSQDPQSLAANKLYRDGKSYSIPKDPL